MAAQAGAVDVVQGSSAVLEVYISGYPMQPTESQITWRRPEGYIIEASDQGVEFQEGHRRLVLSDIQPHQTGVYVIRTHPLYGSASTHIQLNVYGKS